MTFHQQEVVKRKDQLKKTSEVIGEEGEELVYGETPRKKKTTGGKSASSKKTTPKSKARGPKTTFARRYCPSTEDGLLKWTSLKMAFEKVVQPQVQKAAKLQDMPCVTTCPCPACTLCLHEFFAEII